MMRVAIIGSRDCQTINFSDIQKKLPIECTEIISGGARGIDRIAKDFAYKHNYLYTEFLPDYNRYGRVAPLIRNQKIVQYSDFVLAFWDYKSNGTRNTLLYAVKQNKKIGVVII